MGSPRKTAIGLLSVIAPGLFLSACAVGAGRMEYPRTAAQQILVTEAIERSLSALEWPELDGKAVIVTSASPGQGFGPPSFSVDEKYLLRAVERNAALHGARIVPKEEDAEYALLVLSGAIGVDRSQRFLGVKGASSGFIPVKIPELALYKRTNQEGFAKAEILLNDLRTGAVEHHSGPAEGKTFTRSTTVFFIFRSRESDTTRLPFRKEGDTGYKVFSD